MYDTWDGPKKLCMKKALRCAGISREKFSTCWKAKIESCECSKIGQKELLALLEKGGVRPCANKTKLLQKRIWFVNEVVKHNTPAQEVTKTRRVCACLHVYMTMQT